MILIDAPTSKHLLLLHQTNTIHVPLLEFTHIPSFSEMVICFVVILLAPLAHETHLNIAFAPSCPLFLGDFCFVLGFFGGFSVSLLAPGMDHVSFSTLHYQ